MVAVVVAVVIVVALALATAADFMTLVVCRWSWRRWWHHWWVVPAVVPPCFGMLAVISAGGVVGVGGVGRPVTHTFELRTPRR